MKILTADIIERYDPCRGKLETFRVEWPKGMPVTRRSLNRALELGISIPDWEWLLNESLPEALSGMYHRDTCLLGGYLLCGQLCLVEYEAIKLEWIYYYLLGIKKAQLNAEYSPDAAEAPGPPARA